MRIRLATQIDLGDIVARQRTWSNQAGFLRESNIAWLIGQESCWIIEVEGVRVGHIIASGGRRRAVTLRQVCIDRAWQRRGIGTAALLFVAGWAARHRPSGYIVIRTREDITPMLSILRACGAELIACDSHRGARGRPVLIWRLEI